MLERMEISKENFRVFYSYWYDKSEGHTIDYKSNMREVLDLFKDGIIEEDRVSKEGLKKFINRTEKEAKKAEGFGHEYILLQLKKIFLGEELN